MINRWFLELRGASIRRLSCIVYFWELYKLLHFEEEGIEERRRATLRLDLATDRQEAGDITGRERFEDNASV